jgi:signal transduction histidine kinase
VGADLATIAVPSGAGDELRVQVADGAHADDLRGMRFPIEGSISGTVIRSLEVEVLEDVSVDPRLHQPAVTIGKLGPGVFVPLRTKSGGFGTLGVLNRRGGRRFPPGDALVIETFADQAAVALEFAQAQKEIRRLAVLEDRERIAKELHDGVIQSLFAVGMGLEAAGALAGDEAVAERVASAVGELDRVIRDLRNYIFGLRPGILADRQLDQALRQLAEDFQERSGVVSVVELDPDIAAELSSRAGDIVQMTRECLSNVGRHAAATTCRVSLRRDGARTAVLEVDDDGRGFDPAAARPGGQGLGNLRQRAESFGGSIAIDSTSDEGTTVRIEIPL